MKHVLGMAKCHQNLTGAKRQKLELDFLRLVYAVRTLRARGEEAQGYLMVLGEKLEASAATWSAKYDAGDTVTVVKAPLTDGERGVILAQAEANRRGMVAGASRQPGVEESKATIGGDIVEVHLTAFIRQVQPEVTSILDFTAFPLKVKWDFYGQVDAR